MIADGEEMATVDGIEIIEEVLGTVGVGDGVRVFSGLAVAVGLGSFTVLVSWLNGVGVGDTSDVFVEVGWKFCSETGRGLIDSVPSLDPISTVI